MMYSPPHYQEQRTDLILKAIQQHSFATIVTSEKGEPFISHLPLLLEGQGDQRSLIGHCARANPQWRHFAEGQSVTAIFHGPHAYISPSWYQPVPDNVPTWNYVAVHVKGTALLIEKPTDVYSVLQSMVDHFESIYTTGWKLPKEPPPELGDLMNGIVAFRINIKGIQAKFKLSQNQSENNRHNVIKQLPKFAGVEGSALVEYMNLVMQQS